MKSEKKHSAYGYGTDAQYLKWVSYQPSCLDGAFNQWDEEKGEGRNIACHVRRLNKGSGIAIKPPYSAVPMTNEQHLLQGKSERLCLEKYLGVKWDDEKSASWFERQADEYLKMWIREKENHVSVKKT